MIVECTVRSMYTVERSHCYKHHISRYFVVERCFEVVMLMGHNRERCLTAEDRNHSHFGDWVKVISDRKYKYTSEREKTKNR